MTLLLVAAVGGSIAGLTFLSLATFGEMFGGRIGVPLIAGLACLAVAAVASVALARIFRP